MSLSGCTSKHSVQSQPQCAFAECLPTLTGVDEDALRSFRSLDAGCFSGRGAGGGLPNVPKGTELAAGRCWAANFLAFISATLSKPSLHRQS
jgi:hypothetical protein